MRTGAVAGAEEKFVECWHAESYTLSPLPAFARRRDPISCTHRSAVGGAVASATARCRPRLSRCSTLDLDGDLDGVRKTSTADGNTLLADDHQDLLSTSLGAQCIAANY